MKKRPGLTLVETIIGLVIVAIAFYALIAVFITLLPRTARVETMNTKAFLAQEKIEEYLARSWTNVVSAEGSFSGSFLNYQYKVLVTTVATADLTTPAASNIKKVAVRVWGGPVDPFLTVEVVSLVTSYEVTM